MTFTDLMSSLGGALNLWSGISAVVAVEVIELIYFTVKKVFHKRSKLDAEKYNNGNTGFD